MTFTGYKVNINELRKSGYYGTVIIPKYKKSLEDFDTIENGEILVRASKERHLGQHNFIIGTLRMAITTSNFILKWFGKYGYDMGYFDIKMDEYKDPVDAMLWFLKWEYLPHEIDINPVTGQRYEKPSSISFENMDGIRFKNDFAKKFIPDVCELLEIDEDIIEQTYREYL
jgi:hypothetical protein